MKTVLSLSVATFLSVMLASALPGVAEAQTAGTCDCNTGCHAMPGQCVNQNRCNTGYAPFCGVRTASCPSIGWVSCDGTCSCVEIPGFFDGGNDASVSEPPPDAIDAPPPADVIDDLADVQSVDIAPTDAPPPDSTPIDAPPPPDVTSVDAPPPDACASGAEFMGFCASMPCTYQMELGFICTDNTMRCQAINNVVWCVPRCLGAQCAATDRCDPRLGCVPDTDASANADGGADGSTTDDGGAQSMDGSAFGDVRTGDGAGGEGTGSGRKGACGCRAPGSTSTGLDGLAVLAVGLAAFAARRRRS